MRIVGGTLRGRRLKTPSNNAIRPTTNRVREAIFNILTHNDPPLPEGAVVLDLFAGTGAFGLEALSRGAMAVTFVDNAASSLRLARDNAQSLGVAGECRFIKADARRLPTADGPAGLIFADPPYEKGLVRPALEAALKGGWIGPQTCVLVETPTREAVDVPDALAASGDWTYGQVRITRFSLAS